MMTTQDILKLPRPEFSNTGTFFLFVCMIGSIASQFTAIVKLDSHPDTSLLHYGEVHYAQQTSTIENLAMSTPWLGMSLAFLAIAFVLFRKIPDKYSKEIKPYQEKIAQVVETELHEQYNIKEAKFKHIFDWDKKLREEGVYTTVYFEHQEDSGYYKMFLQDNGKVAFKKGESIVSQESPDIKMYEKSTSYAPTLF